MDVSSSSVLLTLTGHSGSVRSVEWSPDGSKIASGSNDNTVQVSKLTFCNLHVFSVFYSQKLPHPGVGRLIRQRAPDLYGT